MCKVLSSVSRMIAMKKQAPTASLRECVSRGRIQTPSRTGQGGGREPRRKLLRRNLLFIK